MEKINATKKSLTNAQKRFFYPACAREILTDEAGLDMNSNFNQGM